MRNLRWLAVLTVLTLLVAAVPAGAAPQSPLERVDSSGLDGATPLVLPQSARPDTTVRVVIEMQGNALVDEVENAENLGAPLSSDQEKAYKNKLENEQNRVEAEVRKHGGKVIAKYQRVYNGLSVKIRASELPSVLGLPGVVAAHAVHVIKPDNETSVPFIGAPAVWQQTANGVNVTGRGIRVAVIDTGIDYTHADFGGPGSAAAYSGIDPAVITPGTFPTAKVVDGYDFAGSNYDANSSNPAINTPNPDPNPIDEGGHGTHVSGTIAGFGVKNSDGSWKIGPGVAPDVLLYAYKVFGREGSTDLVTQAIERAIDPNQDGDISDHVDVINMSLGSSFGSPDDSSAVAAEKAARAGVIVVASAGNSGNTPYVTGSPAVASGVISVASSLDDGIVFGAIRVNSPAGIAGLMEAAEGAITAPLAQAGPLTNDVVYTGGTGCTASSIPDAVAGKIALIDRGGCTFATKILNAQAKGAVAVIVANNAPGAAPIVMGGSSAGIQIPGAMIGYADGLAIKNALQSGPVNVTLSSDIVIPRPDLADTLSTFTSRGPGRPASGFKPEIAAPGQDIRSAAMGTGSDAVLMSGTSMASPHVAGVAALMRQLHPDWKVSEVKAVLMNTTTTTRDTNGSPYPFSLQGAGRVQVDVAAATNSFALPGAAAFGFRPVSKSRASFEKELKIVNKSDKPKTFAVTWSFLRSADAGRGVTLNLPSQIKIPAGGREELEVRMTVDPAQLRSPSISGAYDKGLAEYDGYITLTEQGGDTLRVPFQAVPVPASETRLDPQELGFGQGNLTRTITARNNGAAPSTASFFNLLGQSPRNRSVSAESDLQYAGVRAVPGTGNQVVELVAKTYGAWSTLETNEFDFLIDVNSDGNPDFVVFNYDLGLITGATDPNNTEVSVLYNLNTGRLALEYYVGNSGTSFNTSVVSLYVDAADLGLSAASSSLQVMEVDAFGREDTDWLATTAPAFDISQPTFTVADADLLVAPGSRAQTTITLNSDAATSDLLVTVPANADSEDQAYAVRLQGGATSEKAH
ncbi:MAG: S8 family serine peptidase [Symbiobacteriia bacterium]